MRDKVAVALIRSTSRGADRGAPLRRSPAGTLFAGPAALPRRRRCRHAGDATAAWTRQPTRRRWPRSGRPVEPDRGAVRRHPGPQAGGDEARSSDYLKERLGSADPRGDGGVRGGAARVFPLLYDEHRATPGRRLRGEAEALGARLRLGAVGLSRPGLHDPGRQPKPDDVTLEIGTGSGFQSALLSRIVKQRLFDRDHRAAGQGGRPDLRAARLRQRAHPGRRRLLRLARGGRAASTSSSSPAPRNMRRRSCSSR